MIGATQLIYSALQHHPLSPTLYLLLSYAHLHPNSPFPGSTIPSTSKLDLPSSAESSTSGFSLEGTATARTTLLLGIRLVPKSPDLWREYIKLELGWVEGLRRRWKVLGINVEPQSRSPDESGAVDPDVLTGGEGSFGPEGEDARKSILAGELVVHAIKQALETIMADGVGGMEFRDGLLAMLRIYPSALRGKALEAVYEDLDTIARSGGEIGAKARLTKLTRGLYDRPYDPAVRDEGGVVLSGVDLVEEIGRIGKGIKKAANEGGQEWSTLAGDWLFSQLDQCEQNPELVSWLIHRNVEICEADEQRQYLWSIITNLTKPAYHPSPSLLTRHLQEMQSTSADSTTLLKTARSHSALFPSDPSLQRIRLTLESNQLSHDEYRRLAEEIIKRVTVAGLSDADHEIVREIWTSHLDIEEKRAGSDGPAAREALDKLYRKYLRDSLRQNAISGLHSALLIKYHRFCTVSETIKLFQADRGTHAANRRAEISALERVAATYRPDGAFFADVFEHVASTVSQASASGKGEDQDKVVLGDMEKVYKLWKSNVTDREGRITAVLAFAEWCLLNGHGKKAGDAVDVMKRELGDSGADELGRRWVGMLDEFERERRVKEDERGGGGTGMDVDGGGSEEEEETEEEEEEEEGESSSDGTASEDDGDVLMVQ